MNRDSRDQINGGRGWLRRDNTFGKSRVSDLGGKWVWLWKELSVEHVFGG